MNENLIEKKSKIFISIVFQFIFLSISFIYTLFVFKHKDSFGAPLDKDYDLLPAYVQAQRAWAVFFATLYFVFTIYIFYKTFQIKKSFAKKFIIFTLGIFSFINIFIFSYLFIKEKLYLYWVDKIKTKNDIEYMPSFYTFCQIIANKSKIPKKKIIMNIFSYITWLICLIAFVMNLIIFDKEEDNIFYLRNYYIFNKWSFFTQITNTFCFLYLTFFLLFKKSIIVRNKNVKILISSHIIVVSSIYLFILLPANFVIKANLYVTWDEYLSTINQHLIIPILFSLFMCLIMKKEKEMPINFAYCARKGILYPLWYSLYVYIIPFVCRYSPYYDFTNSNPNMSLEMAPNRYGNYFNVFYILPILIYFEIWFFIMWLINIKLANFSVKKAIKFNLWFEK